MVSDPELLNVLEKTQQFQQHMPPITGRKDGNHSRGSGG